MPGSEKVQPNPDNLVFTISGVQEIGVMKPLLPRSAGRLTGMAPIRALLIEKAD